MIFIHFFVLLYIFLRIIKKKSYNVEKSILHIESVNIFFIHLLWVLYIAIYELVFTRGKCM